MGTGLPGAVEPMAPAEPADAVLGGGLSLSRLDIGGGSWQLVEALQDR